MAVGLALVLASAAGAAAAAWRVRSAVELASPEPGSVVGVEGAVLLARFRPGAGIRPGSVRVWLNDAEVTDRIEAGSNGAYARLHGLLAGENRLRIETFGSVGWPRSLRVRSQREVRFRFRPPVDFDRG